MSLVYKINKSFKIAHNEIYSILSSNFSLRGNYSIIKLIRSSIFKTYV